MLGYFICFYFTVNSGQIAIWDSGFLIEVYSTLCQALGQCRWAKKVNEKRKKHESSENESERKTAGREKGRASKHLFRPLPRPPHVNMSKFARVDSREFAGWTSYEQCFPRWAIVSFEDRQALKELYDMSPDVLRRKFLGFLCLQQNSLYRAARFANSEGILGFQITIQFAAKTKLRITLDCSNM